MNPDRWITSKDGKGIQIGSRSLCSYHVTECVKFYLSRGNTKKSKEGSGFLNKQVETIARESGILQPWESGHSSDNYYSEAGREMEGRTKEIKAGLIAVRPVNKDQSLSSVTERNWG